MAYSPDFRKKVLETLSRGLSVRTTAALFGIHFTTIQNWKKHPEKAKTPQKRPPKKIRTEELLADIEMYPTDYLSERAKRFKCTPAAIAKMLIFSYRRIIMAYSPDFRKKVLETLSRGLSVRTTAALFGIHFTTIQNWKKHPEKAKTPQKRPPKKIRTEELLADIEMYPTDYLSERAKRFKCTPAAIRKAMLRNKFSKKRRY